MKEEKMTLKSRAELVSLEPWEFQYYTMHFECTEEKLRWAIASVGVCPETLSKALA